LITGGATGGDFGIGRDSGVEQRERRLERRVAFESETP
jgi:hypothetical protein